MDYQRTCIHKQKRLTKIYFSQNLRQLYIITPITTVRGPYTYIGDVTAPLLRVIPFKYIQGEIHFHQEFLNLHYVPVAKSYTDQVHISIKGDTGEDSPFITGKTLIKLHFRPKE